MTEEYEVVEPEVIEPEIAGEIQMEASPNTQCPKCKRWAFYYDSFYRARVCLWTDCFHIEGEGVKEKVE